MDTLDYLGSGTFNPLTPRRCETRLINASIQCLFLHLNHFVEANAGPLANMQQKLHTSADSFVFERLDLPKCQWGFFFSPTLTAPPFVIAVLLLITWKYKLWPARWSEQQQNSSRKVLHRRELRSTFVNALCTPNNPGEIRGTVGPWSQAGWPAHSEMCLCLWSTSAGLLAAPPRQKLPPVGSFCRGQWTQGDTGRTTPLSQLTHTLLTQIKNK